MLDQTTLLAAIGMATLALMFTLLLTWLGARQYRYLLSWGLALALMVPAIVLYGLVESYIPLLQFGSFAMLIAGFGVVYVGDSQFRSGHAPWHRMLWIWAAFVCAMGVCFGIGWSGIGTMLANAGAATFLLMAAREHWRGRREAPLAMTGKAALFGITAISFILCAVALAMQGQLTLVARPDNWAEDLNNIAIIVTLAGGGAMTMSLHQLRSSGEHRRLAMTDMLTGMLNRRALFELTGDALLPAGTAVVMFDLDDFKTINDRFGHAAGDEVLRRFAAAVELQLQPHDTAARIGGEEFCVILRDVDVCTSRTVTETIRAALADTDELSAEFGSPTVSAGIAMSTGRGERFETLLNKADGQLYQAKQAGRNCVHGPETRIAA